MTEKRGMGYCCACANAHELNGFLLKEMRNFKFMLYPTLSFKIAHDLSKFGRAKQFMSLR